MKEAGTPFDTDAVITRVRARVLKAVARESAALRDVVPAGTVAWRSFLPGIERQVLHQSGGVMCYLLKFAPGAVLPAHRHPIDEECVVLQGSVRIDGRVLEAGSFQMVKQTVLDGETTSEHGAVVYLRGAPPGPDSML